MSAPQHSRGSVGFWVELIRSFRLAWRLLRDQQVSFATKLIPLGALAYILSPIDFLPDAIVGVGQLDDLAILLLGVQVFIAVVPKRIVQRHRDDINGVVSAADREAASRSQASKEIIDG